jgi:hypothetical protein
MGAALARIRWHSWQLWIIGEGAHVRPETFQEGKMLSDPLLVKNRKFG